MPERASAVSGFTCPHGIRTCDRVKTQETRLPLSARCARFFVIFSLVFDVYRVFYKLYTEYALLIIVIRELF